MAKDATLDIAQLVQMFLADQKSDLMADTYEDRRRKAELFAMEFGQRHPTSIRPSEVKAWILGQNAWRMPTTRWAVLIVIKRVFNWAVNDGLLDKSPIRGLSLPQGDPRSATTEAEFQAMLRHSSAVFRRFLIFLRYTGCRPGEAGSLRWAWVNWQLGAILIPPDHHKAGHRSRKPRIVALPMPILKLLRWLEAREIGGVGADRRVFLNSRRRPWTRVGLAKRLRDMRSHSDLPMNATLHGIRHLFGTLGVKRIGNLKLVSKSLGHASTLITEKHYVHIDQADVEALRQIAEAAGRISKSI
jgi:integrase